MDNNNAAYDVQCYGAMTYYVCDRWFIRSGHAHTHGFPSSGCNPVRL